MNWEKICPNLSFTVENKMRNSHKKKDWSHFKLDINYWDITFLKMLRICQWIEENQWGKKEWTHWKFYPYHRMFGQKALKIYILSLFILVYSISAWNQETKVLILSLVFTIIFRFLGTLLIILILDEGYVLNTYKTYKIRYKITAYRNI